MYLAQGGSRSGEGESGPLSGLQGGGVPQLSFPGFSRLF